jgi:hypothetical protein
MAEKEIEQGQTKEAAFASKDVNLKDSVSKLVKFGGFKAIEGAIKGTANLNPETKAKREIFLKDSTKKKDREALKNTLNLWQEVLSEDANFAELIGKCEQKADSTAENLKRNLKNAVDETRQLETAWRSLNLFVKNAESDKIKNLTILNASMEQLQDLDNPVFIDAVNNELVENYDRLDLRGHYSMVNIPGYLGNKPVVEKWAKITQKSKALLVTDFENLEDPDGVMDFFQSADLATGDDYKSNTVMTCNYLVGRAKDASIEEEEDVYIPPSAALAGNMYKTDMAQVAAGMKYGKINEVFGTRFKLKKQAELAPLEKMGLVPMVNEFNSVMAMSGKTLFSGDNLGKQTYSVVRVFDYVMKTLMDFLNRRAFENYDMETFQDIKKQLVKFLDNVSSQGKGGPNILLEKYSITRFERDPKQKDRVYLDITLHPKFAMKNFVISMDGMKGDGGNEWNNEVK